MKSKDQILLEEAYQKVVLNESLDNNYMFEYYGYSWAEEGFGFSPEENKDILYRVHFSQRRKIDGEQEEDGKVVEIEFSYTDRSADEVKFVHNKKADELAPNTGSPQRVLATVKKIIKYYFEKELMPENTHTIYFTADGDDRGRVLLYKRLMDQISQTLGPEWSTKSVNKDGFVYFVISKSKKMLRSQ